MKIIVLASGSKGNVTYVEYKNTKILIDLGMNLSYIKDALTNHNVDLNDINAILITHTHSDHISGLSTFTKKYNPDIYITHKMNKDLSLHKYIELQEINKVGDIEVEVIHTSHDKPSVGYILKGDSDLVYITDTGYLKEAYHEKLMNKAMYVIESNHDIEILMNGPYPHHLKQRILSDKGHLSNIVTAEFLKNAVGNRTKYVVLAHLSEHNNNETVAYNTTNDQIGDKNIKIVIAKQNEPLEPIEF